MKKLMIAASAALCATVGFSDVTSANVVGYAPTETIDGGEAGGAAFVPVSGTGFDLSEIKVVGYTGTSNNDIELQTLTDIGGTDRSFIWRDIIHPITKLPVYGWYDFDEDCMYEDLDEDMKIELKPGEGLFLKNNNGDTDFQLQSAGQVAKEDVPTAFNGAGICIVNPTPVEVDLGDCYITGYEEKGTSNNEVELQTMNELGGTDRSFLWRDIIHPITKLPVRGWYDFDEDCMYDDLDEELKLFIKPGQGFWCPSQDDDIFIFNWPGVKVD